MIDFKPVTMPLVSKNPEYLAQQIIAEMSFSFPPSNRADFSRKDYFTSDVSYNFPKKQSSYGYSRRNSTSSSVSKSQVASPSMSFGEKIDQFSDCFQLLTDEKGLSWWYDTSSTPLDSLSAQR
eukprot:scaffold26498_cov108-Cylindrotheca_fusiformis.AAC.1